MRRVTLGSAINAPKGSLSSNLWLNYQSFSPTQCPFKLATKACRLSLACCRQTNRRCRPVNDVVLPIMEQLVGSVVFRREIASLKRSQTPVWNQSLLWFSCQLTRPVLRLSIFGSFSQRRRFPIQNFNHVYFSSTPHKKARPNRSSDNWRKTQFLLALLLCSGNAEEIELVDWTLWKFCSPLVAVIGGFWRCPYESDVSLMSRGEQGHLSPSSRLRGVYPDLH